MLFRILLTVWLSLTLGCLAFAQNNSIEGNWHVTWQGVDEDSYQDAIITIKREYEHVCTRNADEHCQFSWKVQEDSWSMSGVYGVDRFPRSIQSYTIDAQSGTLTIHHAYGTMGHWGGEEQVRLSGTSGEGSWKYGDNIGTSSWQKLGTTIESLSARTQYDWETWITSWRTYPEQPNRIFINMPWSYHWEERVTSRGNRPHFIIGVKGEGFSTSYDFHQVEIPDSPGFEPWGVAADRGEASLGFSLWPGVTPGEHVIYLNGDPIIIDLRIDGFPEPKLTVETAPSANAAPGRITVGHPFRIVATYFKTPEERPRTLEYLRDEYGAGGAFAVDSLIPQADPRVFKTRWNYALVDPVAPDDPDTFEPFPIQLIDNYREALIGPWQASTGGADGNDGSANFTPNFAMSIALGGGGEIDTLHSVATSAYRSIDDPTKIGRFKALLKRVTGEDTRSVQPSFGVPFILPQRDILNVRVGEMTNGFGVENFGPETDPIMLSIWPQEEGLWTGDITGLHSDAVPVQLRNFKLYEAAVELDKDQPGQTQDRETQLKYLYPFGEYTNESTTKFREVLLYGKRAGPITNISVNDDKIDVLRTREATAAEMQAHTKGEGLVGKVAIVVLKEGVQQGPKRFIVNGEVLPWNLGFTNGLVQTSFVRQVKPDEFDAIEFAYEGDLVRVMGVPMAGAPLVDTLNAKITYELHGALDIEGGEDYELEMKRQRIKGADLYLSEPIAFVPESPPTDTSEKVSVPPEVQVGRAAAKEVAREILASVRTSILAEPGDKAYARVESAELAVTPEALILPIQELPGRPTVWERAVARAKLCKPGTRTISKWILTNAHPFTKDKVSQTFSATVDDHAAVLLLTDETKSALKSLRINLKPIQPGQERAVIDKARAAGGGPIWENVPIDSDVFGKVRLKEMLSPPEQLRTKWFVRVVGMTAKQAEEESYKAVREAINQHLEDLDDAIDRLKGVRDCDFEDLLTLVAFAKSGATQAVIPRLLKAPQPPLWMPEPDLHARATVRTVYAARNELQALIDYSSADTAVVLSLLSLATLGAGELLLYGGYATAAAAVAAGDAALGVVTGLIGAGRSLGIGDDEDYYTGARTVVGDQGLRELLARRPDAFSSIVGLVMPTISAASAWNLMKNASAIRGAKIARNLDDFGRVSIDKLSDAQKADLAAYLGTLNSRSKNFGPAFTRGDRDALRKLGDLKQSASMANSAPGIGPHGLLGRVGRDASADRGARIARDMESFGPTEVGKLTDKQRADLSAYLRRLNSPTRKFGPDLSKADQEALAKLRQWQKSAGEPILPNAARQTRDLPPGELSKNLSQEELDRLRYSKDLSPDDMKMKLDALRSGRFSSDTPPSDGARIQPSTDGDGVDVTLPGGGSDDAPRTVRMERPQADPNYGDRSIPYDELTDFATNPRVQIPEDVSRFEPPPPELYVPWRDAENVDIGQALSRRRQFAEISEADKLEVDREVRALIDEAAAVGNPWAKRIQADMAAGRYNYRYDAGMPTDFGGQGVRLAESAGHGATGVINPVREITPGSFGMRNPEDIASDIVHEFAHTWRGEQRVVDSMLGPQPTAPVKGEYNEVRAFIAEKRFLRDAEIARKLNGRTFNQPETTVVDSAINAGLGPRKGLAQGANLRDLTELGLRNHPQYREIYGTVSEEFVGLTGGKGGSTIALQRDLDALDTALNAPSFSQLDPETREIWRAHLIQQMLDGSIPRR